jgi:hypothetical protein
MMTMRDWRTMTPQEVLDAYPALTVGQVAYILSQYKRDGELDRRRIIKLVRDGLLSLIDPDPTLTTARWTIAQGDVRHYLAGNDNVRKAS